MPKPPLGQLVHAVLISRGQRAALELAHDAGHPDLFERVLAVAHEEPAPSFLHSALCAMSLPVRRPLNDQVPIIRQDGQYTLVITPKAVVQNVDGQHGLAVLGVPYGSLPRLILIHIMTEAVRAKSRHVMLGASFTDWMRKMGFRTISYGPRGSATLIRQQLDRLLACEWMIRWDSEVTSGTREFGIREIKLANEYGGTDSRSGSFRREIYLTEAFFEHLRNHAVPLNEHAIRQLRDSATALDLYTWLAFRLPRISPKRPATLTWQQLAVHFGNSGANIRKFRQTVRDAWQRQVSAVYPEARADFDTTVIRLHASPAPLQRKLVPSAQLAVVAPANQKTDDSDVDSEAIPRRFLAAVAATVGRSDAHAWFRDAGLELNGDAWQLVVPTRFVADWIRGHFLQALDQGRRAAGLGTVPEVIARAR